MDEPALQIQVNYSYNRALSGLITLSCLIFAFKHIDICFSQWIYRNGTLSCGIFSLGSLFLAKSWVLGSHVMYVIIEYIIIPSDMFKTFGNMREGQTLMLSSLLLSIH